MNERIRIDRRGFRPTRGGSTPRCPHCGNALSHGLPGNPRFRKIQPCQLQQEAKLPAEAPREDLDAPREDLDASRQGASA